MTPAYVVTVAALFATMNLLAFLLPRTTKDVRTLVLFVSIPLSIILAYFLVQS